MARARIEHQVHLQRLDRDGAHFTAGLDALMLKERRELTLPAWQWWDYGRPVEMTVGVSL